MASLGGLIRFMFYTMFKIQLKGVFKLCLPYRLKNGNGPKVKCRFIVYSVFLNAPFYFNNIQSKLELIFSVFPYVNSTYISF